MPRPDRLASIADVKLHVRRQPSLMYSADCDATDIRIRLDLEHMRQGVLAWIGSSSQLFPPPATRLPRSARVHRRISFQWIRQQLHDHFQQLGDSSAGLRRREDDGNQMPLAQGLLEGLM